MGDIGGNVALTNHLSGMTKLTTDKEKKEYIIKHWKVADSKTISLMLKKYWKIRDDKRIASVNDAEEIYNG